MTAKYEMQFNDGGTAGGLKKISDAHKDAAVTGKEMSQQTGKATEQIHKEGDEAARTAKYLENLNKSYAVSTAEVTKYGSQTKASMERATTSVQAFGNGGIAPLQVLGSTAAKSREGLEKLAGTASFLGDKSLISSIQGMNAFGGVLAATASPLGALTALVASASVLVNELGDNFVNTAKRGNYFDEAAMGILDWVDSGRGRIYALTEQLEQFNQKGDQFTASQTAAMKSWTERVMKSYEDLEALRKSVSEGRESYEVRVKVSGISDVKELERLTDEALRRLQALQDQVTHASSPDDVQENQKKLEEETQRVRRETQVYEARRQQILDEQRAAQIKAADEKKKEDEEAAKRAKEEHEKRMKEIEDEKNAKIQADKEAADKRKVEIEADIKAKQQAREDALRDWHDQRRQPAPGNQQAQAPSMPSAPSSGQTPNNYGEGQAPTAGNDNSSAYAAAMDPLSQFSTDFSIGGNSSIDGNGSTPAAGSDQFQAMVDMIDKKLNDANIARTAKETEMERIRKENYEKRMQTLEDRFGTRDKRYVQGSDTKEDFQKYDNALRKSYRDDERDAARDFDKKGPTQEQKNDAIDKISDKAIEVHEKQNKVMESDQEFKKTATDNMEAMAAKVAAHDNYIQSQIDRQKGIKQTLSSMNGGSTPSNATSRLRAKS